VVAVVDDIPERRRLEAVRTDFVANISHELKTPVGAIGLLAETLQAEGGRGFEHLKERLGLALLHRIDPETAHGLALKALRAGMVTPAGPPPMTTTRM